MLDFPNTLARDECLGYENCRIFNVQRPFSHYRKMNRNIIINPEATGIDTISIKGYYATADPTRTQAIGILIDGRYGTVTGDVIVGTLITSYYISAYGRR